MSGLLDDLRWRRLIHQMTDPESLPKLLDTDVLVAYIGFDPTADSLHIGHLLQICLLRRLQLAGHRPIALVGGGTGMIGDPTGKSDERNLLTPEDLAHNKAGIQAQLERFIDFGASGAILEDNATWLGTVPLLEFLRDVGKQFTVNEMIRKDSVRSPPGDEAAGHLVHRVQLHAPPGVGLPAAVRPPRLPPADGRERPMGQHHRRRRPHPPAPGDPGVRSHLAAGDQGRRHQVRQDRSRCGVARRGQDQPVPVLPVLHPDRRRRGRAPTCATSPSSAGMRSRSWTGPVALRPSRGRPSGPSPGRSPGSSTAPRRRSGPSGRRRSCSPRTSSCSTSPRSSPVWPTLPVSRWRHPSSTAACRSSTP